MTLPPHSQDHDASDDLPDELEGDGASCPFPDDAPDRASADGAEETSVASGATAEPDSVDELKTVLAAE
ncbi:MAG TPA: hypothetical protein DDX04_17620, partial [Massilia sp.]|nr:hypothetical protein [Massilia sp.]